MRPEVERRLNAWQKRWERMSETEDTPAKLWDELCAFQGLDEADLQNSYCVAQYISLLEKVQFNTRHIMRII